MGSLLKGEKMTYPISNQMLADTIISTDVGNKRLKKFVSSEGFLKDPIAHLINEMIDRGVGMCQSDDGLRSSFLRRIPNFADQVASLDLKSIAIKRYENHPNKESILRIFNESIASAEFQRRYNEAINEIRASTNLFQAEERFRVVLTVFFQAENLQLYQHQSVIMQ